MVFTFASKNNSNNRPAAKYDLKTYSQQCISVAETVHLLNKYSREFNYIV